MIDLQACYSLLNNNYSVITIGDSKIPNTKWKEQQTIQLSKKDFEANYNKNNTKGVGLATGYYNLEVIDIDTKILPTDEEKNIFWNEYLDILSESIEDFDDKIVIYRTKSGGYHLLYRCEKIEGNLKIAKPKGYKEALIETRGIGGYVFVYSDRVSANGYLEIKTISESDRNILMECSRFYNYVEDVPEKIPTITTSNFQDQDIKTWDDYNQKNKIWDLICNSFTEVGEANGNKLVLRNGSKSAHSGYIFNDSDKLFLYSTGTNYPHEKPLSSFDVYRIDYHSGDYKSACSQLYKDGYGTRLTVKDNVSTDFWAYSKKGAIILDNFRYKKYLESINIFKHYPNEESESYLFIQKDGNFIDTTYESKIKDIVLKHLYNINKIDVWNMMSERPLYFKKEYLSFLDTPKLEISKDTKESSIIYYKNTAVKITKDDFKLINYDDVKGFVWKKQVIDRNIALKEESDGMFKTFLWKIASEDKERYYTLKSVIGYLLHSYKDKSLNKAIIFNDELISDTPNGGSGKGLFHAAISKIKKMSMIDGKSFDNSKSFLFQTVDIDSQVLLFDDVKKGFIFEDLFSVITEGITLEKKGKDAIKVPFEDSPKISITTNYTIKGDGDSHYRRVFEVEMSSYFNKNHTPTKEFGCLLFDDWDNNEWGKFDNYMLRCIQYYLQNGLVESQVVNLDYRKLINNTNKDFIDFMDSQDFNGQRYYDNELKNNFISDYEDYKFHKWFTSTLFNKWLVKYCDYKFFEFEKGKTNGQRWLSITDNETADSQKEAEIEIPF